MKTVNRAIRNLTKSTVLIKSYELADTHFSRFRGLMFRKSLPPGKALLIEFDKPGKWGIWMLFMRFPLDLVFLDYQKRVASVYRGAKPINLFKPGTWRVYYPEREAKYCLELSSGALLDNIRTGDELMF